MFYDYFKEPKFSKAQKLLKSLDKIAEARNVPVAQVAVNWITVHPLVDTALMGVRNKHEADENCAATAWELTAEEIAALERGGRGVRARDAGQRLADEAGKTLRCAFWYAENRT